MGERSEQIEIEIGDNDLEAQETVLPGLRTLPVWSIPQLLEHCLLHSGHSNTC